MNLFFENVCLEYTAWVSISFASLVHVLLYLYYNIYIKAILYYIIIICIIYIFYTNSVRHAVYIEGKVQLLTISL